MDVKTEKKHAVIDVANSIRKGSAFMDERVSIKDEKSVKSGKVVDERDGVIVQEDTDMYMRNAEMIMNDKDNSTDRDAERLGQVVSDGDRGIGPEDISMFMKNAEMVVDEKAKIDKTGGSKDATPGANKPHKCEVCFKTFNHLSNLTVHMRTHTGDRPYKCTMCDWAFSHSSSLTKHYRTHTGEKLYPCEYCNVSFKDMSTLSVHKRIHTGDKPYKCDMCDRAFSRSSSLILHQRTHTGDRPYKCKLCPKGFSQSCGLIRHMRSHTGEKPYKCDICGRPFAHYGGVQAHRTTHTGEKPHQCNVCGKHFTRSSSLAKHKRIHIREANKANPPAKLLSEDNPMNNGSWQEIDNIIGKPLPESEPEEPTGGDFNDAGGKQLSEYNQEDVNVDVNEVDEVMQDTEHSDSDADMDLSDNTKEPVLDNEHDNASGEKFTTFISKDALERQLGTVADHGLHTDSAKASTTDELQTNQTNMNTGKHDVPMADSGDSRIADQSVDKVEESLVKNEQGSASNEDLCDVDEYV